jgi:hypothetical protein
MTITVDNTKPEFDIVAKLYDSKLKGQWNGGNFSTDYIFFTMYLLKHYSHLVNIPIKTRINISKNDWWSPPGEELTSKYKNKMIVHLSYKTNMKYTIYPFMDISNFRKEVLNTKKRFTVIPISIYYSKFRKQMGHSLCVIYDSESKQVELFDSIHGQSKQFHLIIKQFLRDIFKNPNLKVIPLNQCKIFGTIAKKCYDYFTYHYQATGYCTIWVYWYIELRLKNPNLNRKQLFHRITGYFKKDSQNVCRLIIGYTQFVDSLIKNYKITKERTSKLTVRKVTYKVPQSSNQWSLAYWMEEFITFIRTVNQKRLKK